MIPLFEVALRICKRSSLSRSTRAAGATASSTPCRMHVSCFADVLHHHLSHDVSLQIVYDMAGAKLCLSKITTDTFIVDDCTGTPFLSVSLSASPFQDVVRPTMTA